MKKEKVDPNKLPVYEIVVEDDDQTGIQLISLVDAPAIGMKGMFFSENEPDKSLEKVEYHFKEVEDKQIIVGPALIPDLKIRRKDEQGNEYFVVFTKDTISKMVEKFNRYGSNRRINADHSNRMVDAFIVEDWIVEDPVYDKSRKYGFEVPIGTYMIKVKVEDKDFWMNEVKEAGKYGFSIEGLLSQMLVSLSSKIEDTNEKIYHSENEAFEDLDIIDLIQIFELEGEEFPECSCSKNIDHKFAKEGLVHPNCRCDLMLGDFQISPTYIGKDGKEYPCEVCNTAFRKWNSSGRFSDVFGNRYTKIDIYPYFVRRNA